MTHWPNRVFQPASFWSIKTAIKLTCTLWCSTKQAMDSNASLTQHGENTQLKA
jgi:hypothetical protein